MIARKRHREDLEEEQPLPLPSKERYLIPPDDKRDRCQACKKDTSVAWVICALSQMYVEERWHVYQYLRNDQPLTDYREVRRKRRRARAR